MGFLHNNDVVKAGLSRNGKMRYSFEFDSNTDFNDFSCALIQIFNGKPKPLMIGSTKTSSNLDDRLASNFNLFEKDELKEKEVKEQLNKSNVKFDDDESAQIEKEIDDAMKDVVDEKKCANCKYREAFYAQVEGDGNSNKDIESNIVNISENKELKDLEEIEKNSDLSKKTERVEKSEIVSFYDDVKPQLIALFDKYETDDYLENIIPDSKWVKVDYEENGHYYVVGMIYENSSVKYICYGIPGVYADNPPKELQGYSQWLALDDSNPFDKGYWIMYQNAETGANEHIEVI